ncbi:hypothetical protein B1987_28315 [Mycobacterium kansasii]|nr:hypothetical protein B1987_28315 [Mycobacterium kansasii]
MISGRSTTDTGIHDSFRTDVPGIRFDGPQPRPGAASHRCAARCGRPNSLETAASPDCLETVVVAMNELQQLAHDVRGFATEVRKLGYSVFPSRCENDFLELSERMTRRVEGIDHQVNLSPAPASLSR